MRKLSSDEIRAIAAVAVHNPRFVEWLKEWRTAELEVLPNVTAQTAVAQGRCQVLTELCRALTESPEWAAQLRNKGS